MASKRWKLTRNKEPCLDVELAPELIAISGHPFLGGDLSVLYLVEGILEKFIS